MISASGGESVGRPAGFVLNVYKEVSWSSHHAVDRVRRILGVRQVGHAGTLDPLASGVLAIGVGRATKLLAYLGDLPKTYEGTIRLGMQTATGDLGGAVIARAALPSLDLPLVEAAATSFLGDYEQVPPMVSAVKQRGQRLYTLARRGLEVTRSSRRVQIERFTVRAYDPPRIDFEVVCSKGTYIRTLAEDLAVRLGTVGVVECLVRTAVGDFSADDAVRLISLPGSSTAGLRAAAIPMEHALRHLPRAFVSSQWGERVRRGELPPSQVLEFPEGPPGGGAPFLVFAVGTGLLALGCLGDAANSGEDPRPAPLRLVRVSR